MAIKRVQELDVYQEAFAVAMTVWRFSKNFPVEERYSLTDQVRRSSRSVCANLSESWSKRRYLAVFRNKLSDAEQEAGETETWLEFANACGYLDDSAFQRSVEAYELIIGRLHAMDRKAATFCFR